MSTAHDLENKLRERAVRDLERELGITSNEEHELDLRVAFLEKEVFGKFPTLTLEVCGCGKSGCSKPPKMVLENAGKRLGIIYKVVFGEERLIALLL